MSYNNTGKTKKSSLQKTQVHVLDLIHSQTVVSCHGQIMFDQVHNQNTLTLKLKGRT